MYRFARPWLSLLVLLPWIAGCGGDANSPTDPEVPRELTVTPTSGVFGTPVAIEGLDLSTVDPALVEVRFGDHLAVARAQPGSGTVIAGVPIPLAEDGTVAASTDEALDVTVTVDGEVVAMREAAFTIEAFVPAPGAAQAVVASFASIVDDVEAVALALAPDPSLEHGYALALLGAARELLTGEAEGSLAPQLSALANDAPEALALVDGILAGSGALERVQVVASRLEGISAVAERAAPQRRTTELTDTELAMRMQLYVMVRDVGQQVIGETTSTWGTWMGTVVGGISFVGVGGTVAAPGVALAGTIGTVLGLVNTAVNTIALSYLPAQIDSFELTADPLVVAPGEVAQTEIWIQASNQPATITTLDLVDLVLNAMGVLPGSLPSGHPRRVALIQTIDYFLGIFRGLLSNYASQVPTSDLAFDVASIPSMTWRARVTDARYVTPLSHTPEVIDATDAGILAWRAATDGEGEGRIFARIDSGPDVTSLVQIPGYEYNAGAFGDQILTTETLSVYVSPPLLVVASMDDEISEGGINGLEVRAGTVSAIGDTLWLENVLIECVAMGGSVDPAAGVTGPDGRFDTFVSLAPGSAEVRVDVSATGDFDQQATRSVSASAADVGRFVEIDGLPDRLGPGESATITVRVGERANGTSTPLEGVEVRVVAFDAGLVPFEGLTDAVGELTTTVTMPEISRFGRYTNELRVQATATFDDDETISASTSALRTNQIVMTSREVDTDINLGFQYDTNRAAPGAEIVFFARVDSTSRVEGAEPFEHEFDYDESGDGSNGMSAGVELRQFHRSTITGTPNAFGGATFTGSTEGFVSLSNPDFELDTYTAYADGETEIDISFDVYGDPAAWSLAGQIDGARVYFVWIFGGPGDNPFECEFDDDCGGIAGSGLLEPGRYSFVAVERDFGRIDWRADGENAETSGRVDTNGSLSATLTVGH